jgi:hypothetical protein
MKLSNFEDTAAAFTKTYPIGTTVRMDELFDWSEQHGNGLAPDNLIDSVPKKFSSLRRHINDGGASRNLPEEKRFILEITDTKSKTLLVRSLTAYAVGFAEAAPDKAAVAGMKPLKSACQKLDNIKDDELPDAQREAVELLKKQAREDKNTMATNTAQMVDGHYASLMVSKGLAVDKPHALRLLTEAAPMATRRQKTLKAIY